MSFAASITDRAKAHPRWTALILGVLSALGFAPLSIWPLSLLAMGAFIALVIASDSAKSAAKLGWIFGIGHFTVGSAWIAGAFRYQESLPVWLGWAVVPLIGVYLGIYPAIAAALARRIGDPERIWRFTAIFAGLWIVTEMLRSWMFTGYAWNPFGIILLGPFDRPGLAAVLPWLGTYALSGVTVFVAGALMVLTVQRRFGPLAIPAVLLAVGVYVPAGEADQGTVQFTLVQPDVRQDNLNNAATFETQFRNIATLSLPRDPAQERLVIWPESSLPDYLRGGYPQIYYDRMTAGGDPILARRRIARAIGPRSTVLAGVVDLEIVDGRAAGARNAVTAINGEGEIVGGYSKAHLVPFGEYLAMRWLLEPLGAERFVDGTIDFWPGPGPQTLDLGSLGRVGPQICYEIIFSGQVVDQNDRPDFIYNPSNDGWFGSFGPPQHLAQARMRAIEEGLPVLRSTTTGISAVIDARGVVRQHIGSHRADRIDGLIPPAHAPTLFSRLGNYLPLGLAFLVILIAVVAPRRRQG
ncbi:apolipoprotein N-acyltransferase [Altererythrobacter sp. ZODW24]|uniref:apolipoprotein N-acyltransferase n=1 Tax=Altererythrobacter sp. ZODW24 TaxID=2185142 RepID=UPI000DF74BFD|nr:apolipoprotein N-acyltransferase [Altererythrobacter sp. ZODW24]